MIIPVRCFTCNKIIGDKYSTYLSKIQEAQKTNPDSNIFIDTNTIEKGLIQNSYQGNILNELKITRYCCRRMFLSQVDIVDII